jgi:hypothetical protein
LYPDRQVLLYDSNPQIQAVWKYLIHAAPDDILGLPDMNTGDSLNDMSQLSQSEKWLIGFCINPASSQPKITASKRTAWNRYKKVIAGNVPKIKHWCMVPHPYTIAPDIVATWFIDPPYQQAGKYYYGYNQMDFTALGLWCRARHGQIIVCENAGADWMDFDVLAVQQGMKQKNVEVVKYLSNP